MRTFFATLALLMALPVAAQDLGGSGFLVRHMDGEHGAFNIGVKPLAVDISWPATPFIFLHASDPAAGGAPGYNDTTGFSDAVAIDGTPTFDSSGSEADVYTGSVANPTWETAELNGEPIVQNVSTAKLESSGAITNQRFFHDDTSAYTIAVVVRQNTDTVRSVFFSTANIDSTGTGCWLTWRDSAGPIDRVDYECPTASGTYLVQLTSADSVLAVNTWALLIVTFDGTTWRLFKSGTELDSDVAQTTHETGNAQHKIQVSGSSLWTESSDWVLFGVWKRELSASERADILSLVTTKWGVT